MGSNSSRQHKNAKEEEADMVSARKRAIQIYNYRVQNYNYLVHGPREYYMMQVEAEYELECIPEYLRSGGGRQNW